MRAVDQSTQRAKDEDVFEPPRATLFDDERKKKKCERNDGDVDDQIEVTEKRLGSSDKKGVDCADIKW